MNIKEKKKKNRLGSEIFTCKPIYSRIAISNKQGPGDSLGNQGCV